MTRAERLRLVELLAELDTEDAEDDNDSAASLQGNHEAEADKALAMNEMRKQLQDIDARLARFSVAPAEGGAQAQVGHGGSVRSVGGSASAAHCSPRSAHDARSCRSSCWISTDACGSSVTQEATAAR